MSDLCKLTKEILCHLGSIIKLVNNILCFRLGLLMSILIIIGCNKSPNHYELERYVHEAGKDKRLKIEALEIEEREPTYHYIGADRRSPFQTQEEYTKQTENYILNGKVFPTNQYQEKLKTFDIHKLKMIGFFKQGNGVCWGLVKDGHEMIYKVRAGIRIGSNGEVIKVTEDQIKIDELITHHSGEQNRNTIVISLNE